MNYRHHFHAGNPGDVLKHVLLARILIHLKAKDAAFRYMDTHAGIGLYDLRADEAKRTGEAERGVFQFLKATYNPAETELLQPYVAALKAYNAVAGTHYPGSPFIAKHVLRQQDKMSLAEKHQEDAEALAQRFRDDRQVTLVASDGWAALKAWLPPPERRGMILIDPPFEEGDDRQRMLDAMKLLVRKWSTGILALWYPIKGQREADRFALEVQALAVPKTLRLELNLDLHGDPARMNGSGLIIVNPPWKLEQEARVILPALARSMRGQGRPRSTIEWLVGEAH
jgi:23S rRNA (adenine2030-N6)-methyltransferase